jgi:hypothetical protein
MHKDGLVDAEVDSLLLHYKDFSLVLLAASIPMGPIGTGVVIGPT